MKKVYATLIGLVISLTGFSQSCLPEGIEFSTQAQIDNFQFNYPNCTEIEGDVTIFDGYFDNITNLNGLSVLTSIGGTLTIRNNNLLINLTGLNNVSFIGGSIIIYGNDGLTSLTGLDNVIAGSIIDLSIYYNESLETCNIQSICDYLSNPNGVVEIYNNASGCYNPSEIANDCGFTLPCLPFGIYYFLSQAEIDSFQVNYPNCTYLEGNVTIYGADIDNLNGLSVVTYIGGDLDVFYNDSLNDFAGLENITSIGVILSIHDNLGITSLTGLENIDAGSITDLYIYDNRYLSDCNVQSICDYLANPNGDFDIVINDTGCNSPEEVEAACGVGINETATPEPQITIYPNPSTTAITIALPSNTPFNNTTLSIYNVSAQPVILRRITEPITVLDIGTLPSGVYFVKVADDRTVMVRKFIKQ